MYSVDEIKAFNEGTIFPKNYSSTYEATKFIQETDFDIPSDIVNQLRLKLDEKKFYIEDDTILRDIAVGLIKGNIILQGPPGTGKTTIASLICEAFNVDTSIITAVSDWTTYDTIGGYQPSVNDDGDEIIIGKEGRIVESIVDCCNTIVEYKQYGGQKQAKWLIVDELNRSEIDKVFGDLFTAFGSDDTSKRTITLWFENDINKKILYIPNQYRMIGVMNNIDKNFVFDLSQGLSRRFSFITINPPKIEKFNEEINRVKVIASENIVKKFTGSTGFSIDNNYIEKIYNDPNFREIEANLLKFLIRVRYDVRDSDVKYLGLPIGTAQIIDVYETIIINIIISKYFDLTDNLEKTYLLVSITDSILNSKIVPQFDGFIYEKLSEFYNSISEDEQFKRFVNTIDTISKLV